MRNLKEKSIFSMAMNESLKKPNFVCSIEQKDMLNEYQGKTAYCWIYSSVALLKQYIKDTYGIENYEFSYAYLMLYDKYERMKCAIDLIYQGAYANDYFNRELDFLCGDKGDFSIFVDLINKYGVAPRKYGEDTYCVRSTNDLNYVLNNYLISLIRDRETIREISKETAIKEIYALLKDCYGDPIENFDVDIIKKETITPKGFYEKYLDKCLEQYITIANYLEDESYVNKHCCYKGRGNFVSREKSTFINVSNKDFKQLVIQQLQSSATYISMKISDGNMKEGFFDDKLYDLGATLNLPLELDHKYIMQYKDGLSEHALLLVGVDEQEEKIVKWKVKDNNINLGKGGYYVLSDSWFEKYVCSVVVNKKLLSDEILCCLEEQPLNLF